MPIERRDLERTLVNKLGFQIEGRSHRIFVLRTAGKVVAKTMTSRGVQYRTLGDALVAKIAREIHCSHSLLIKLVAGAATREDYLRNLVAREIISEEELNFT